jgi:putative endonuclease
MGEGRDPRQANDMPMIAKVPCVYLLASRPNGVLYVGVTSDLEGRMFEHVNGVFEGFSKKYGVTRLVYYEMHETMDEAIRREKRIKEWRRAWKVRLIHGFNPEWLDLYDSKMGVILDGPSDIDRSRQD